MLTNLFRVLSAAVLLSFCVTSASAEPALMRGAIEDVTHVATFDDLQSGDSLAGYLEDGIRVSVNANAFQWNPPGLNGPGIYYADTGVLSRVEISLEDNENIDGIEMQIASGWNIFEKGPEYVWVQLYSDQNLVAELDLDLISGGILGIGGGGFNRILIGAYDSAERRDEHNPFARNAIALDNIRISSSGSAPTPSGLAVALISAGAIARRRRR